MRNLASHELDSISGGVTPLALLGTFAVASVFGIWYFYGVHWHEKHEKSAMEIMSEVQLD